MEEALLAVRRAALTGALEKTPPPGTLLSAGQAEAQKEEFWRGHVKVGWCGFGNIGIEIKVCMHRFRGLVREGSEGGVLERARQGGLELVF